MAHVFPDSHEVAAACCRTGGNPGLVPDCASVAFSSRQQDTLL